MVLARLPRGTLVYLDRFCTTRGIPEVDPLTMTTPQILQLLYSFNTLSPEFSRCLDRLIKSDEDDHYLLSLQGSELIRLVDFFDRVRVPLRLPSGLRKGPVGPRDYPCD